MLRVEEFKRHTSASHPGEHAKLYAACGPEPRGVAGIAQNLLLPAAAARGGRLPIPDGAKDDVQARTVRRLLSRLLARDGRPLSQRREIAARFFGTCRDYALLACSLFREHGVPARLRVGFATYFERDFLEDHWVCEYWGEGAWRLLDAQIDSPLAAWPRIDFDPTDVPAERFLRSGEAWQRMASGEIPADRFGVSSIGIAGTWVVAGGVFRDMAVLSGREELLPWDYWGQANDFCAGGKVPDSWMREIDELAAVTMNADVDLDALLRAYADRDWLYLEDQVTSYGSGAPETVNLRGLD